MNWDEGSYTQSHTYDRFLATSYHYHGKNQWCIAKNGGGYTQMAVENGLKVPCLFMITEVSIRCPKNLEVAIRRIPAYTPLARTGRRMIRIVSSDGGL